MRVEWNTKCVKRIINFIKSLLTMCRIIRHIILYDRQQPQMLIETKTIDWILCIYTKHCYFRCILLLFRSFRSFSSSFNTHFVCPVRVYSWIIILLNFLQYSSIHNNINTISWKNSHKKCALHTLGYTHQACRWILHTRYARHLNTTTISFVWYRRAASGCLSLFHSDIDFHFL